MELRKLRLYHLKKQNLLQKAETGAYADVFRDHIALHSTDYLTPYLSLWARIENFDPVVLFDDLNRHRNALRLRAFRGTVFVVHKDILNDVVLGLRIFLAPMMAEAQRMATKAGIDLHYLEQRVHELLSGNRWLTVRQIKKELEDDVGGEPFILLQRHLEFKNVVARTSQRYLTDKIIRYGLMEEWMPGIDFDGLDPEEAAESLALKYVQTFGPVCLDDLSWWLPLNKTKAKEMFQRLEHRLSIFAFNGREYVFDKEDHKAFEAWDPPGDGTPIVNFLPYEDHFPKAYFVRNWYVSEETTPKVFHVTRLEWGQIRPSIWLDGKIVGRWELEWTSKAKSSMRVDIVDMKEDVSLSPEIMQEIETQKNVLETFVNEKLIPLMK